MSYNPLQYTPYIQQNIYPIYARFISRSNTYAKIPIQAPKKSQSPAQRDSMFSFYAHAPTRDINVAPPITEANAFHLLRPFKIP